MHHLPGTWMCSPTWKLSTPCSLGIFTEASSCRLTQSPAPLPSLGDGDVAANYKLLIMVWSFWRPAPILKLSRSPPRVTSLEQMTSLSPRIFQGIQVLCVRCSCHPYHSGNYRSFSNSVSGAETKYIFMSHRLKIFFPVS